MPDQLEGIVRRMIDAGEPEENIATVIQHFKAQAPPAPAPAPTPERSATARFVGGAIRTLNPIAAVQGAYNMVRHPVDTYHGLVDASAQQFEKAAQAPTFSEQAGHFAAGILPGIGPAAANVGEQIASGDVAGGMGSGLAMVAAPTLARGAGRLVSRIAQPQAEGWMQSALKPTTTLAKARAGAGYGSKQAIARAVLDEGRLVTRGGLEKAQTALDATDEAAQAALKSGAGVGVTVDPFKVTQAIDAQGAGTFGKQINAAPDVNAVQQVHDSFATNPHVSDPIGGMAPMPADLAHEFAMNTGKNLRGKFGRLGGATVEAEKAGREAITSQLRDQIPELKDLWNTEGRQITVRDALEQALARTANRDPIGLGGIIGAIKSPTMAAAAIANSSPLFKSLGARYLDRAGTGAMYSPEMVRAALLAKMAASDPTQNPQGR